MGKGHVVAALSLAALGSVLSAAPAAAYLTKPGDTLWGISNRTGVPVDQIVRENQIVDPDRIRAGRELIVGTAPPAGAPATQAAALASYTVRTGDTLWSISRKTGVPAERIVRANRLANPSRIFAGQRLELAEPFTPAPAAAPAPKPPAVTGEAARRLLVAAAREQGLNPSFVLAVSLWESGYNQSMVSKAGAIGLMQILPTTANWAGPALLGRPVDIADAGDNARLGAALLRLYVDDFRDPKLALAAYYQGAAATHEFGVYPSSRQYVDGIWALRNVMEAST